MVLPSDVADSTPVPAYARPPAAPAPQDAHFAKRYSEILESAAVVFKDADDDFATLAAVKKKLEEWKSRWVQERRRACVHISRLAL